MEKWQDGWKIALLARHVADIEALASSLVHRTGPPIGPRNFQENCQIIRERFGSDIPNMLKKKRDDYLREIEEIAMTICAAGLTEDKE